MMSVVSDVIAEMAFAWIMGLANGDEQAQKVAKFWADAFGKDKLSASIAWAYKIKNQ